MLPVTDYSDFISTLHQPRRLVLTANQRLADQLHKRHPINGIGMPPAIMSWQQWINSQAGNTAPMLMNHWQTLWLWQHTSPQRHTKTSFSDLTAVQQAWQFCHQWRLDISSLLPCDHNATPHFVNWAARFSQALADNHQMTPELWVNLWCKQEPHALLAYDHIDWLGFTEFTPQLKTVIEHCAPHCTQAMVKIQRNNTCPSIKQYPTQTDEYNGLLKWARDAWQKNTTDEPIICVIPDLNQSRNRLIDLCYATFPEHTDDHPIFNISVGQPLYDYSPVKDALSAILLIHNLLPLQRLSSLMQSAHFTQSADERYRAAQLDRQLRKQLTTSDRLTDLKHIHTQDNDTQQKILQRWISVSEHIPPDKQHISQWIDHFQAHWKQLGWPGQAHLDSRGYQIEQRWQHLLNEARTLHPFSHHIHLAECMDILIYMAKNTLFQIQSRAYAPIQILGIMEAIDTPCAGLWLCGLDENSWPSAARPNPWLPKNIQCELRMPHADITRESDFATDVMKRLQQQTHIMHLSYHLQNDTGVQAVSPLVSHLEINEENTETNSWQAPVSETIPDDTATPTSGDFSGGSHALKTHICCPFKNFAQYRLHVQALESWRYGLDKREQGIILHDSLQALWEELGDQKTLLSLKKDTLTQKIDQAISHAHQLAHRRWPGIHNTQWLSLTKPALGQLIAKWLSCERNRPHFSVTACEQTQHITLNNITFKCRIDRIDTLDDGSLLLIDYKTGEAKKSDWLSTPPANPQLPLYTMALGDKISAIAFANIHYGEQKWVGVSDTKTGIPDISPYPQTRYKAIETWSMQRQHWLATLTKISDEIASGDTRLTTQHAQCQHCAYSTLCRVTHHD